jgi:hypothetical protein
MSKSTSLVGNRGSAGYFDFGSLVSTIFGFIELLLIARFILALLGANVSNALVAFVVNASTPLIIPFHNIFNIQTNYGAVRFELDTLVALIVYGVIGGILSGLAYSSARR